MRSSCLMSTAEADAAAARPGGSMTRSWCLIFAGKAGTAAMRPGCSVTRPTWSLSAGEEGAETISEYPASVADAEAVAGSDCSVPKSE